MERLTMSSMHGRFRLILAGVLLASASAVTVAADEATTTPERVAPPASAVPKKKYAVVPSEKQIDINHASLKDLKTLPGIGEAEAKKIIAGRPYVSKAELVTKNVLPEGLYISIKYRIIAIPDTKPKAKK